MFDVLIESKKASQKGKLAGTSIVSLVVHTGIIGGAIFATYSAAATDTGPKVDTALVYVQPEQKQPDQPPPPQLDVQFKGFQTVVAPTDIPTNIPPVNLQEHFDPKDFSGVGVEGGVATGIVPSSDAVLSVDVVQEKPERLAGPQPVYPPLLQQAQIEGQVMVEAIIDTLGHVEPTSLKVVQTANPGFNESAKQAVLHSLFRPARVYGKAVRVLIHIPMIFKITR
ncbi:MAG TPA: energy transducer TonB [Gemmatimonadales bacterium]|nr:energy transducer TonB [Gemmatimonadales bacterium]